MNAGQRNPHQDLMLHVLSLAGVRVINPYYAYSLARDKFLTNFILRKHGIQAPRAMLLNSCCKDYMDILKKMFNLWGSVLIKPRCGYGGSGIVKCESLEQFLDVSSALAKINDNFYIEEFIEFENCDYRVELLNNEVVYCYSRMKSHSYKTNVSAGGRVIASPQNSKAIILAKRSAKVLGLVATIVDMVKSSRDGKFYVLEVNDSMGIFAESCLKHAKNAWTSELDELDIFDAIKLEKLVDYIHQESLILSTKG